MSEIVTAVKQVELDKSREHVFDQSKLYAVVDKNLDLGGKACQAAHALRAYADAYPYVEGKWWTQSNRLVILEHENVPALLEQARAMGITCAEFREPYWNDAMTAIAVGPDGEKLLRGLPLAYSSDCAIKAA